MVSPVSTTGENRTRPGLVLGIQVRRARELTSEGLQVLRWRARGKPWSSLVTSRLLFFCFMQHNPWVCLLEEVAESPSFWYLPLPWCNCFAFPYSGRQAHVGFCGQEQWPWPPSMESPHSVLGCMLYTYFTCMHNVLWEHKLYAFLSKWLVLYSLFQTFLNHRLIHTLGGYRCPFLSNILIIIQGLRSRRVISFIKLIMCIVRKYKENPVMTE